MKKSRDEHKSDRLEIADERAFPLQVIARRSDGALTFGELRCSSDGSTVLGMRRDPSRNFLQARFGERRYTEFVFSLRKLIALALALVALSTLEPAAAQTSNQLISWSQLCSLVSGGTFTWKTSAPSQCTALPNRIIAWADFSGSVNSSGCPTGNPMPLFGQMVACKSGGGGSYTLQSDNFNVSVTNNVHSVTMPTGVSISNPTYPVHWSYSASGACTSVSGKIGSTTVWSNPGTSGSGTYTGGATGSYSITVTEPSGTCDIYSSSTSWYY